VPWIITRTSSPTWENALRNFAGVSVCCGCERKAVELYRRMVAADRRHLWTVAEIDEPQTRRVLTRQELEIEP
jgi:predicted Fe-S protein YdhL (DUF1289 family)